MNKFIKLLSASLFILLLITFSVSAASTNTIFTRSDEKIKCSVCLNDIPEGSVIILTPFKNGRCGISQLKTVSENKTETFFIETDTKEVRVYVFEDISSIAPLTEGEKIEVKLDSITDEDWSEWV